MTSAHANTVLGPVPVAELGVVSVHEALLSVVPGAQFAYDISMDRAEIFDALEAKVRHFKEAGGGTLVDATGMFHGRDLTLLETLARSTGVQIIASTGMGPEDTLGGYFLTPQTNPPTPWPAEKFANLFTKEVTEGMVVPRVERRGAAGLIATAANPAGITATEVSLFQGAARAAKATGVPVSIRFGADAATDLQIVLDEGLAADRVVVGGLDRADAAASKAAAAVAAAGAYAAIDRVGRNDDPAYLDDPARVALVAELIAAGLGDRILISASSIAVAKGQPDDPRPFDYLLTTFLPMLGDAGVSDADIQRIVVSNPHELLAVRT